MFKFTTGSFKTDIFLSFLNELYFNNLLSLNSSKFSPESFRIDRTAFLAFLNLIFKLFITLVF